MISTPKWLSHLQFFMVNMTFVVVCCRQVAAQPTSQVTLSSFSLSQIEQMLQSRELARSKGEFGTINTDSINQLAAELKNREKPLEIESADLWAIVQDKKLYKEVRSDAARMLLNRDDPKIESHLLNRFSAFLAAK
ncbi:MAG: hypothetical protein SFV81_15580 [Pirellulaceae bacterium]|nr:hypothetical protein [Pirellulaceae bacterium]